MEINNNEITNINTVEKIDILGMDLESLQEKFVEIGLKKFNASQVLTGYIINWYLILMSFLIFLRKIGKS